MINPYIAAGLALMAFLAGWQSNGWRLESGYKQKENKAIIAAVQEERANAKVINDLMVGYEVQKVKDDEKRKQTRDAIRDGAIALSVPVKACYLPAAPTDATGAVTEARAELDQKAAARITDITDDGDKAIEQLNQIIVLLESTK